MARPCLLKGYLTTKRSDLRPIIHADIAAKQSDPFIDITVEKRRAVASASLALS